MYQFVVATRSGTNVRPGHSNIWTSPGTDGGDISTMSLTSGTNKWASRAVVALQLAAWSAVGIVLLEKGATSLQQSDNEAYNVSHGISRTESSERIFKDKDLEEPSRIRSISPHDAERSDGLISVIPLVDDRPSTPSSNVTVNSNNDTSEKSPSDANKKFVDKDHRFVVTRLNIDNDESTTKIDRESSDETFNSTQDTKEQKSLLKNRKRARFAKVGSGGAAAAVAMVAVGAVMLILGPAVIILRALDERRQERRFLKLSGEEDLPPSYEQATADGDQAPSYSSLNLDTIVTSSPPATASSNNSTYLPIETTP